MQIWRYLVNVSAFLTGRFDWVRRQNEARSFIEVFLKIKTLIFSLKTIKINTFIDEINWTVQKYNYTET